MQKTWRRHCRESARRHSSSSRRAATSRRGRRLQQVETPAPPTPSPCTGFCGDTLVTFSVGLSGEVSLWSNKNADLSFGVEAAGSVGLQVKDGTFFWGFGAGAALSGTLKFGASSPTDDVAPADTSSENRWTVLEAKETGQAKKQEKKGKGSKGRRVRILSDNSGNKPEVTGSLDFFTAPGSYSGHATTFSFSWTGLEALGISDVHFIFAHAAWPCWPGGKVFDGLVGFGFGLQVKDIASAWSKVQEVKNQGMLSGLWSFIKSSEVSVSIGEGIAFYDSYSGGLSWECSAGRKAKTLSADSSYGVLETAGELLQSLVRGELVSDFCVGKGCDTGSTDPS
eukprot:Sspe_Gene.27141::Locus_11543_Transcript_1_1_Confidence_1.000_Length_1436::g.27141::m.27141